MNNLKCIILGGGHGKRLYPLTQFRSKPAVPIGTKYRLIDIPISNSLNSGIKDIYVLTQFNSVSLNNHIHQTYKFDYFSDTKVQLLAAEQTMGNMNWFQGTADAVRKHMTHYSLKPNDNVLILSGDHLYRMDFNEVLRFHIDKDADITLAVNPVEEKETRHYGIMNLDDDERIVDFKEKPKEKAQLKTVDLSPALKKRYHIPQDKPHYLASMGIYIFKARILEQLLLGNESDFGKEIIPKALFKHKAYGYYFKDYWRDIGTIDSFYDSCMELTKTDSQFSFLAPQKIYTHPRFLPPTTIAKSVIDQAVIPEGCVLEETHIERCSVGLRSILKKNSQVEDTVLMGADYYEWKVPKKFPPIGIGENTFIRKAIIDKNARIGKNVSIRNEKNLDNFDSLNYCIRDGIVIIPKNGIIPDGTKI